MTNGHESEGLIRRNTQEFKAKPSEKKIITPDLLLEDNASDEARERMGIWFENYSDGNITLVWKCSDARVLNPSPEETMVVNTVAATDDPHVYERLIAQAPFRDVAILGHFDGELLRTVKRPKGCGAQEEKNKLLSGEVSGNRGIHRRVDEKLQSDDVVLQVNHSARHFAEHTTKPVIAMVQDHRTGDNSVVGVYSSTNGDIRMIIPRLIARFQNGELKPDDIYLEGTIPTVSDGAIDDFQGLLENASARKDEASSSNPDFFETQEVQDPTTVILTTDPQPIENRYPGLFGTPNTAFQLLVPRQTTALGARLALSGLRIAADHAQYPLSHAVENFGRGGAFANTNTLYIETKDMGKSEFLANYLKSLPFVQAFLALSNNHQIIVGGTGQGKLREARKFA
jgi:hypothetical protein